MQQRVVVLLATVVGLAVGQDPGLFGIRHLTEELGTATFSNPVFSPDERYIYVTAKGGTQLNSNCEHVYRVDRRNPPDPISLASTGLGTEPLLRKQTVPRGADHILNSNVDARIKAVPADQDITSASTCLPVKCTADNADTDTKPVCDSTAGFLERVDGTANIPYYSNLVATAFDTVAADGWASLRSQNLTYRIHTEKRAAGETVLLEVIGDDGAVTEKTIAAVTRDWADNFVFSPKTTGGFEILYHGTQGTDDTRRAMAKGVLPLASARIYRIADPTIETPVESVFIAATATEAFMYPAVSPALPGVVFYTKIVAATGRRTIMRRNADGTTAELSDPRFNSYQAQLSADGKFITFVSDRRGGPAQLFIAKLEAATVEPTYEADEGRETDTGIKVIKDATKYTSEQSRLTQLKTPRFDEDESMIMFTAASPSSACDQIYQLNVDNPDAHQFRRLSSGMHHYSSPNFHENNRIVYSATLRREFNDENNYNCKRDTCAAPKNAAVRDMCKNDKVTKRFKPLYKEADLFVANEYGIVERQLTRNDYWDGEVRVAPDFQFAVFTRKSSVSGTDMITINLDGTAVNEKKLKVGGAGYHFDYSFGPAATEEDGIFVFASYRPVTAEEKTLFRKMMQNDVVDVPRSNIYMYNLATKKEKLLWDCEGGYCRSPYVDPLRVTEVLFLYTPDASQPQITQLARVYIKDEEALADEDVPKPKLEIIADLSKNAAVQFTLAPTTARIVYTEDWATLIEGTYEAPPPPPPPEDPEKKRREEEEERKRKEKEEEEKRKQKEKEEEEKRKQKEKEEEEAKKKKEKEEAEKKKKEEEEKKKKDDDAKKSATKAAATLFSAATLIVAARQLL